ncbi:MAG: hypothetical protein RL685_4587 [Pseudomonadota bacterium]|jgi:hypothetical protein
MADDLIQFDGGVLVADLLQESTVTDASELTQYAIEDGSFISDHVIRQPQTLSLTLVQTETPISETTGFTRTLQALGFQARPGATQDGKAPIRQSEFRPAPLLALSAGVKNLLFGGPPKEVSWTGAKSDEPPATKQLQVHVLSAGAPVARVNEFHDALLDLLTSATPCIVTVKGKGYVDLVLTSVGRTDAQGQAGKASFRVEFKQVATVETKTVNLPPVPKAKAPKALPPKPAEVTPPVTEKKVTASLQAIRAVRDLVKGATGG